MKQMDLHSDLVVGCAILLFCLAGLGYCQDGTALMLEVSPAHGGTLNLQPGVHTYDRDAAVTLTAVPKPGYQFVYWVGAVDDATASTTMVFLDSPKIVIAVFERTKFDLVDFEEGPDISGGGGRLIRSGPDYAAGLERAIGGRRPSSFHLSEPQPPEINDDVPVPEPGEDFPVPETEDDFPVPVPEPATITFLITGMLVLARHRRRQVKMH
ncbi:MAG: hypothetical protein ABII09_05035 [Planctomycetota bacterium]